MSKPIRITNLPPWTQVTGWYRRQLFFLPILVLLCIGVAPTYAQSGQALNFDGTNDHVIIPNISLPTGGYTLEFWMYWSGGSNPVALGVDNGNGVAIAIAGSGSTGQIGIDIENVYASACAPVTANVWTHVALVVVNNIFTLYVNGQLFSCLVSRTPITATPQVILGGVLTKFQGSLDEVRIWNVARTGEQIAGNKDCGLKGNETGLYAYYTFNQGTADGTNTGVTSLTDASGNSRSGTLYDFALTGATSNWISDGGPTGSCRNCNMFVTRTTANGLASNTVNDVVVVGETIYAATARGLDISTNNGQNFTTRNPTSEFLRSVNGVAVVGSSVYAATVTGLGVSTDGGLSFTRRSMVNGLPNNNVLGVFAVAGASPSSTTVYAVTSRGLVISTDGGQSFSSRTTTGLVTSVFAVGTTVYVTAGNRLNISTNGGQTFTALGPSFGSGILSSVSVRGQTVCVSASPGGFFISTDGGQTFSPQRTTANGGLGRNAVFDVFVGSDRIYAATFNGLSVSKDGGQTFTNMGTSFGLGSAFIQTLYVVDNSVYAGSSGGLSLPGFNVQTNLPNGGQLVATAVNADPGTSLTLRAADTNAGYSWNTNAITKDLVVTTSGTYAVTAVGSCPGTGSVQVTFLEPQVVTPSTFIKSKDGLTAKAVISFDFSTVRSAAVPLTAKLATATTNRTFVRKPIWIATVSLPSRPGARIAGVATDEKLQIVSVSPPIPNVSVSKPSLIPLPAPYNVTIPVSNPKPNQPATYTVKAINRVTKETLQIKKFTVTKF